MEWTTIYLFATEYRKKSFKTLNSEDISYYLQKDRMLKELSGDTYHKWKGYVLDKNYSFPAALTNRYDSFPESMFYSTQIMSMMYAHMFHRVQEENISILWKHHTKYLGNNEKIVFKIGVFWYRNRLWFIGENENSGRISLFW